MHVGRPGSRKFADKWVAIINDVDVESACVRPYALTYESAFICAAHIIVIANFAMPVHGSMVN